MNHWSQPALRLSDRDRKAALGRLSREHARGRINASELDERVDAVTSARTYGDLAPVFSDLAPVLRRVHPFPFRFPLLPLLIIGVVIAATGHVPWVPIAVAAVLILVFAPWRRRRWAGHQSWAC